jgi:hypothetical protein
LKQEKTEEAECHRSLLSLFPPVQKYLPLVFNLCALAPLRETLTENLSLPPRPQPQRRAPECQEGGHAADDDYWLAEVVLRTIGAQV